MAHIQASPARTCAAGRFEASGRFLLLTALWAALMLTLPGCKHHAPQSDPAPPAVPLPEPGSFLDTSGAPLDPAFVAAQAAKAAYVLVGEGHPSACDHQVQARVIELMAEAGVFPAVGLEMVSLDRQKALDRFNKGLTSVDRLAQELDWDKSWGYPFEVYRPVFEVARKLKLPLFALNAPRDIARAVGRTGLSSLGIKQRLGLPSAVIMPSSEQEAELRKIFDIHPFPSEQDREAEWKSFLTVQGLWDTTMARRALEARVETRRPVVILAGGAHVERGWGIAMRLERFDPAGQRLLVMPWRGQGRPDPRDADVFFYCPEVRRPRLGLALKIEDSRVTVTAVVAGSRAESAGIKAGDVLVKAQGQPVGSLSDLHSATVKAMKEEGGLALEILREGSPLTITIALPKPDQGS